MVKKIVKARKHFEEAGLQQNDLSDMMTYSIKKMYHKLRGNFPKVSWRKLICNNLGFPKWIFNLRLVAHGKLLTRDRLAKWGITKDTVCSLCDIENETIAHMFCHCKYSAAIWERLLHWQEIDRKADRWPGEQVWAEKHATGKGAEA
uniref:Reverse transcriptase zinc-binding domain-containing protein n=1 Tax=Nicotiana tabacum TaxID=4097 RepID=A0A1S4CUN1_TOBAC|nr:PREDICTED: uncharacterized protein LOC107822661 [Nicotiana tabacum]